MDSRDLSGAGWSVLFGSCLDRLPELADNSVDAVVCDPPYELGFMGKSWDSSGIAFNPAVWAECLRVLKPGGHILAFGGSRTWHRIAVAVEDAGFEVRDSIAWLYGSGFPKSLDVSKAIDKAAGVEREVIETIPDRWAGKGNVLQRATQVQNLSVDITAPSTADAVKWQGWGTALKPAFEPVIVGRKPLGGRTVAANVLLWGTGGLNIDGTRIGTTVETWPSSRSYAPGQMQPGHTGETIKTGSVPAGRWPSNVMLDEVTAGLVDEQSGVSKSVSGFRGIQQRHDVSSPDTVNPKEGTNTLRGHNDTGGASRFFYVAKASKRDRNEGLEHLDERPASKLDGGAFVNSVTGNDSTKMTARNFHPTVKPTTLMRYLIKLVTPPGGTVLDPFTGSGSTGKAAILEGFEFIGCELTEDYLPIIQGRIDWAVAEVARLAGAEEEKLF